MAREYDRKNPAFSTAQMGVATNHSSGQDSVASMDHAQSDDAINDESPTLDPNISGMKPTADCYTWLAGKLDGWCDNDDYREYFEKSRGCNGMLACDTMDGDYDDNGGYPTAVGHSRGVHGSASGGVGSEYTADSYAIGIVTRRI